MLCLIFKGMGKGIAFGVQKVESWKLVNSIEDYYRSVSKYWRYYKVFLEQGERYVLLFFLILEIFKKDF